MKNKMFEKICRMTQSELKAYLKKELGKKYNNITSGDGFIYAKGEFPVMLVAHMDTVHREPVKEIVYDEKANKISSPQGIGGDDRCGIYSILRIIEDFHCSVLFTEDEEIGCVGAIKFASSDVAAEIEDINYIIELDRKGSEDAVFYDCDNPEFEDFILQDKAWKFEYGSYSDIVEVAPALGVEAVNFSCGYYQAHTVYEYVMLDELEDCIKKVKELLARTGKDDKFEFIEREKYWTSRGVTWYEGSESEDYYDDSTYYVCAETKDGKIIEQEYIALSEAEAIGLFLIDNPDVTYGEIETVLNEDEIYSTSWHKY